MIKRAAAQSVQPALRPENLPRHVAVIMDGNGRWAKKNTLPKAIGHARGADRASEITESCAELGISYLTLYAFSSENWQRPEEEVSDLMRLLRHYLAKELKRLHQAGVQLRVIGDLSLVHDDIRSQISDAVTLTRGNTKLVLTIALSYGGRQEIAAAARRMAEKVAAGELAPEDISEHTLTQYLYDADLPDPDLLIRTGGDHRISNFLLWQMAYTEMVFTNTLWPDFNHAALLDALAEYSRRERRYGKRPNHG